MQDTELDRIATILEKLAYEEDVRKIIRKIIKNNQIDEKAEQIFLMSQKRDHSQKNPEGRRQRNEISDQKKPKTSGGHQRYESADNTARQQAMVQDQMRRKNVEQQFTMTDNNLEHMLK